MELIIRNFPVRDIVFGAPSSYRDGVLTVDAQELERVVLDGLSGYAVSFDTAKPGQSCRILHIMDAVKPAWKPEGSPFPGWLPGENRAGQGLTHRLEGMALMQSCVYPGIQEGIVDMAGEGARYGPFSQTVNLVMLTTLTDPGKDKHDFALETERMLLRAAQYLGRLSAGCGGYEELRLDDAPAAGLPTLGYICYIQAQGDLRNVHLNGGDCTAMAPVSLPPAAVLDGAVVSANYIIACQKNPTWLHQDSPVIRALWARHGTDCSFGGVILSTESSMLEDKQANARRCAQLAAGAGWDGVVITQEGGGHADVDLMLALDACEALGVRAVLETNEIAGPLGDLPPLVSCSKGADAIVTNGNNDALVRLDGVERSIGAGDILGGRHAAKDGFETSLGILYAATNQLGGVKMRTQAE